MRSILLRYALGTSTVLVLLIIAAHTVEPLLPYLALLIILLIIARLLTQR